MSPMAKTVIPQALLDYIQAEAARIHHGTIKIEINADKPDRVDVVVETRERFSSVVKPGQ